MTDQPLMTGRQHWLEAERLIPSLDVAEKAIVRALLALAAPAYAFHQARPAVVADSPNITGTNEGFDGPRMNDFEDASCACTEHGPCWRHAQP